MTEHYQQYWALKQKVGSEYENVVYKMSFTLSRPQCVKASLKKLVQTAATSGNKRAEFLLQSGFDRNHRVNLAKIVIYFREFNQAEIYETEKYTVSIDETLHQSYILYVMNLLLEIIYMFQQNCTYMWWT